MRERISAGLDSESIDALLAGLTARDTPRPEADWILPRMNVLDQLQSAAKDPPTADRLLKMRDELSDLLDRTR